jgi:glycine cleavage system H protein
VESTKSVSELYAPISGTVASTNDELETEPEKLNTDPYGGGWICTVTMSEVGELDALMDAEAYQTFFAG